MARAASVQSEIHQRITSQIGRLLASSAPAAGPTLKSLVENGVESQSGMATCFDVWSLRLDDVFAERDLRDIAHNDHRWHHQLMSNGKAVGFARSNSDPQDQRYHGALTQLFEGDIAESIERAITVIDREDAGSDAEVRLLLVPALYVTALWLVEKTPAEDRCVIVGGLGSRVRQRPRLTSARNFMARLRKAPHAQEMRRPKA